MLNRQSSGTVRGSATTILVFFLTFAFAEIGNPLFCIKNPSKKSDQKTAL